MKKVDAETIGFSVCKQFRKEIEKKIDKLYALILLALFRAMTMNLVEKLD